MVLWAWNQWEQGRIQNRSTRILRIVCVRARWRQCGPSLACVHCAWGFLGRVSAEEEKGLHSACWGFFRPAIVIASPLSSPMFSFLSGLIDAPLLQRRSVMSLSTLWGFESRWLLLPLLFFCLVPHLSVSVLPPVLENSRIGEALDYIQGQLLSPYAKW